MSNEAKPWSAEEEAEIRKLVTHGLCTWAQHDIRQALATVDALRRDLDNARAEHTRCRAELEAANKADDTPVSQLPETRSTTETYMKPFDNEHMRTKTVWTDAELEKEIELLTAADVALRALGDRYDVALADVWCNLNVRNSMAIARMRA